MKPCGLVLSRAIGTFRASLVLVLVLCLGLTSCAQVGSVGVTSPHESRGKPIDRVSLGAATTAVDLGGIDVLASYARKEGTVVIAGAQDLDDPYRARLAAAFSRKYSIKVEFSESRDKADVVALPRIRSDQDSGDLVPYRVALFAQVAEDDKEPSGLWTNDYSVAMSIGYDPYGLGYPQSATDALASAANGAVAVRGGSSDLESLTFAALMFRCLGSRCGTVSDGVDRLREFRERGVLGVGKPSTRQIIDREQSVVIDWDNAQGVRAADLSGSGLAWSSGGPELGTVKVSHGLGVRRLAQHPAAARLWMEFIFSLDSQNELLHERVVPSLLPFMDSIGGVDLEALQKVPLYPVAPTSPSTADVQEARELIRKSPEIWRK